MPRSKRWLFDSGLRVPMVVRVPEKFKKFAPGIAGLETSRLVSFVDFAPTVLQLAGVPVPEHMQGQAFLGGNSQKSEAHRRYVFGFRDRMDERYDIIRSVRDKRYWGATGMLALGPKCGPMAAKLRGLLRDPAPDVQVAAATALCGLPDSEGEDRSAALQVLVSSLTHQSPWVQLRAANALDHMDAQAKSATKDLEAMRTSDNKYVQRVVQKALRDLRAR